MEKGKILNLMKKCLSDSKMESESAKEKLEKIVRDKLNNLQEISKFLGLRYWDEYSSEYGWITIINVNLEKEEIEVDYEDSWGYGGYCNSSKTINIEIFSPNYEKEFFEKNKKESISELEHELKRIKDRIITIENTLNKVKNYTYEDWENI